MHFFPLLSVAFSVWRGGDDGVAGERGSATVLGQWLIQTCFEGWLIMCCGNLRPRELTRQKDFVYETHGIFSDATFETSYSISADTPPQTSTNHDRFQPKEPLRIGEKNNRETCLWRVILVDGEFFSLWIFDHLNTGNWVGFPNLRNMIPYPNTESIINCVRYATTCELDWRICEAEIPQITGGYMEDIILC